MTTKTTKKPEPRTYYLIADVACPNDDVKAVPIPHDSNIFAADVDARDARTWAAHYGQRGFWLNGRTFVAPASVLRVHIVRTGK